MEIRRPEVALLLATYNGVRFVGQQIRSLRDNAVPFTLHWLDDHSTDGTRDAVRAAVIDSGIKLREWHEPCHYGWPRVFFSLVESVEADIYLFCDQDDIWQPGKIDATATDLAPDLTVPVLCFSDALAFQQTEPDVLRSALWLAGAKILLATQEARSFTFNPALGNTIGFTRPLRDLYLRHMHVAHEHALSHDSWLYLIAAAVGTVRLLRNVPTTLYRLHDTNAVGLDVFSMGFSDICRRWKMQQVWRRWMAKQAAAFCLAAATLPPGPKLERLLAIARVVATLASRQSPTALLRLIRQGGMPPGMALSVWLAAACLFSDADR